MHPLEGVIVFGAGIILWLIGSGKFPGDPLKRQELIRRLPWVQNKTLMYAGAGLLWALGLAAMFGLVI